MTDRFTRFVTFGVFTLLLALVAQPFVERFFLAETAPRAVEARGSLADAERSTIQLFERVSPSVVQVVAIPPRSRGALTGESEGGTGSGFVWDRAGHVVTNNHVIQNAGSVAVRLASGDTVDAEIVGRAPNYDLAVLRLTSSARLPAPVAVGESDDLKVGQSVFAIGNPFGLDQSLTTGIISALRRRLPTSGGREIAGVIQTDAAINPGNSGGPLLDSAGRLIGVTTAIYSPSGANAGVGFAIPVDIVNRVVPELIRAGRVPTPGIGISAADESIAAQLGVEGVIIADVVPGSPAQKAGLRGVDASAGELGDVVVGANDRPVRHLADLTAELERTGIGKPIELKILRGNRQLSVEVAVADVGQR